jgi:hypothetical protein
LWKANIAKSQGFRQTNVFARCVLFKKNARIEFSNRTFHKE